MSNYVANLVRRVPLPLAPKAVLRALADYADDDGSNVFPSVPRLAFEVGITDRSARDQLRTLESMGCIALVERQRGTRPNVYRIDLARLQEMAANDAGSGSQPTLGRNVVPGGTWFRAEAGSVEGGTSFRLGRNVVPPETSLIHQGENTHVAERGSVPAKRRSQRGDDPAFNEFWAAYPRNADKGHGRKAWATAIRKADPATIIAGARAYAAKVAREETPERFIAHASTWLNGERWEDGETGGTTGPSAPALPLSGPAPSVTRDEWLKRAKQYHDPIRGGWRASWGPDLLSPDCRVPADLWHLFEPGTAEVAA